LGLAPYDAEVAGRSQVRRIIGLAASAVHIIVVLPPMSCWSSHSLPVRKYRIAA